MHRSSGRCVPYTTLFRAANAEPNQSGQQEAIGHYTQSAPGGWTRLRLRQPCEAERRGVEWIQMKTMRPTAGAWFALALATSTVPLTAAVHIWDKQELTFTSARSWANAYTDVTVFVDLTGPNFKKRIYGFWDGGQTFRVRLLATAPGTWTWRSGSNPAHTGLAGKTGSFVAADWTEAEKLKNPVRRGLRNTGRRCALRHADLPDLW